MVVSGTRSIVHSWTAGSWSGMPMLWTARTWKMCSPWSTATYVFGDVQAVNGALSSEHWKVAPDWSAEKVNVADGEVVGSSGAETIVVSGRTTSVGSSIVQA